MQQYREKHLLAILEGYEQQNLPLDLFISHYFRNHKSLGSKDRGYIADLIYSMMRWKSLLDYLALLRADTVTWARRYAAFQNNTLNEFQSREDIPSHIRLSCPEEMFNILLKHYGKEKTEELCRINNGPAPTTVRVNPLKTSREALLEQWKSQYEVAPCKYSNQGIVFLKKINFFSLPEFKSGLFEVQDEGSQLLADLIQVEPGQQVMDYCSGSGGKTLAFAPRMQHKGQIYLHDIRAHILAEAKKRLRRAGIQNSQVIQAEDSKLKKLKKKMDWVIVDAPCTGTGTMRRNPDMKWKFTEEMLKRLVSQQRVIFEKALSYLAPNGKIAYMTCSIFPDENELQIEHFVKTYNLEIVSELFKSLPTTNGMDGFFGCILKKKA